MMRCNLVASAVTLDLRELVNNFDIVFVLWPQYAPFDSERRQVGFEVELAGSHCSDPNHIDPSCPDCVRLRAGLFEIAEELIQRMSSSPEREVVSFKISSLSGSILYSPRFKNRPFVAASIHILHRQHYFQPIDRSETAALNRVKKLLAELGVREA